MKKNLLLVAIIGLFNFNAMSQCTTGVPWCTGTNTIGGTDYLGGDGSNFNALKINAGGTTRITILGTNGNTGIGNAYSPSYKLDVNGEINVGGTSTTTTNSYRLGTNRVFWHNGNTSDIFVGVGADASGNSGGNNTLLGNNTGFATTTGHDNTMNGNNAGIGITTGYNNIYIGSQASYYATSAFSNVTIGYRAGGANTLLPNPATGSLNVFIGEQAGYSVTSGSTNVFVGYQAGTSETTGGDNTFVGYQAGFKNNGAIALTQGIHNSFFGDNAGVNNSSGRENTFIGGHTGQANDVGNANTILGYAAGNNNDSGDSNLFLGSYAYSTISTLINASAIGANAVVTTSQSMILGSEVVNVGIGLSGDPYGPLAKLHVQRNGSATPISDPTAVRIENNDIDMLGNFNGNAFGLTVATLEKNLTNIGGSFRAETATTNTAGNFEALGSLNLSSNNNNNGVVIDAENAGTNTGIRCNVSRGKSNFGANINVSSAGYFSAGALIFAHAGPTTASNYGVAAVAWPFPATNFNVAIYGNAPVNGYPPLPFVPPFSVGTWAGYFNGDLGYTGTLYLVSDSTMKTDIEPITSDTATSILSKLNAYTYYFDTLQLQGSANVSRDKQFGFMAQQIESVAPNLVLNTIIPAVLDSAGNIVTPARDVKMYNPMGIIPLLVQANKSLSSKDSSLEVRVSELEQLVNACCSSGNHTIGSPTQEQGSNKPEDQHNRGSNDFPVKQTIELASSDPILYQNQPNPFDRSTTIRYFIPENSKQSKIIFEDETGRIINEIEIKEFGQGSISVNASLLNSGIYTYSLEIGGKIFDSKKMVRTK